MAISNWYWYALYIAASVTLAIVAISSAMYSISNNKKTPQETVPIPHDLSMNASIALRNAGFIVMADLIHHSPAFFKPAQNSTIFAIKDSSIKNTSHTLWFLKTLLLYHTTNSKLSFQQLLNTPQGTCLRTLLRRKNVSVTNVDHARNNVEINHVLISYPNIFLSEQLAVHGVDAPFSPLNPQDLVKRSYDLVINSSVCGSNNHSSAFNESKNGVEWNRVVHLLGAKGYASFSIALHSVLDGIKKDYSESLDYVTIFAPPDLALLGSPLSFLDRAVRLHILPQRFSYKELISLPVRTLLKTLVPDVLLELDGVLDFVPGMVVNGVEIVAPDMLSSEKFVVHGISRAFKMSEITS